MQLVAPTFKSSEVLLTHEYMELGSLMAKLVSVLDGQHPIFSMGGCLA